MIDEEDNNGGGGATASKPRVITGNASADRAALEDWEALLVTLDCLTERGFRLALYDLAVGGKFVAETRWRAWSPDVRIAEYDERVEIADGVGESPAAAVTALWHRLTAGFNAKRERLVITARNDASGREYVYLSYDGTGWHEVEGLAERPNVERLIDGEGGDEKDDG